MTLYATYSQEDSEILPGVDIPKYALGLYIFVNGFSWGPINVGADIWGDLLITGIEKELQNKIRTVFQKDILNRNYSCISRKVKKGCLYPGSVDKTLTPSPWTTPMDCPYGLHGLCRWRLLIRVRKLIESTLNKVPFRVITVDSQQLARTIANSNQNRFPKDFLHTFTVILPSVWLEPLVTWA